MLENIDMAPADAILGLTEAFKADTNPEKINLGVGVYKDAGGATPILESVRRAEQLILDRQTTKSYLGIDGMPALGRCVRQLLFGDDSEWVDSGRAVSAQTPGGTGALRIAGDLIQRLAPQATVWLPDPTWANHKNVFTAAGLATASYPYYDAQAKALDFEAMVTALQKVPAGDVVLFHACCHNPTGMDPSAEQWATLAQVAAEAGFLSFFDFAYQGFGDGLDADAAGLRAFADAVTELMVSSSFSKNFGLYNQRIGALTYLGSDADISAKVLSHIKKVIRANYSNPPAHGAQIVTTILTEEDLRDLWRQEVADMRERINGMRRLFVQALAAKGVKRDFSFITTQRGMFSFSGLTKEQVHMLRDKYSIYIVDSGRINVAGMTSANMDRLCEAIADVLGD